MSYLEWGIASIESDHEYMGSLYAKYRPMVRQMGQAFEFWRFPFNNVVVHALHIAICPHASLINVD